MTILARTLLPVLVLAGVFLPALVAAWRAEAPWRFDVPPGSAPTAAASALPVYVERFVEVTPSPRSLHTPTLSELAGGDLLAVWKAARAGDRAVALHAARFDRRAGAWRTARPVTTSHRTQRELGRVVTTLTNPVLLTHRDGALSLFYVTAWWQWSTASLALKTSRDHGQTWTPARRLVTSPVANLGTLVKAAPVLYTDGSVGVPAYHEMGGVFPHLLRLSERGEVLDRVRIHQRQAALQPSIVPLDDREAVVLMRNYLKGPVLTARTRDAGRHWDEVEGSGLPNPNAPVMGVRLRDGSILLVFNNSPTSRESLSLALSRDGGRRWALFHTFEEGVRDHAGHLANFGYPYAIQASDGMVHVLYVWHPTYVKHDVPQVWHLDHLKHVSFNEAWIRERTR
jgi:predicted neuraminidase